MALHNRVVSIPMSSKKPESANPEVEDVASVSSVVHVFRSPKGGLFRHVRDLVEGQADRGIRVGILCDSTEGDAEADRVLEELGSRCALGVYRVPFSRVPSISDISVCHALRKYFRASGLDILHGHGAKGGMVARLMARSLGARSIYTPHGGALHYDSRSVSGAVYLSVERILKLWTDGVIFESLYAHRAYEEKVGRVKTESRVIYNGLKKSEFESLDTDDNAADFLFFGELRLLKGLEPLVKAAARLKGSRKFSMIMAGSGPDSDYLHTLIREFNLENQIRVVGPIYPASKAMVQARCIILPSLAESLPYAVLEALACGKPVITTNVGGIPEIFDDQKGFLIAPENDELLFRRMQSFLDEDPVFKDIFIQVRESVSFRFSYERMVTRVIDFYQQVAASRKAARVYSLE